MRGCYTWLVVALLGGALLAGCGGSSNSPSGTVASGASNSKGVALTAKQRVAACKHTIQAPSTLSASTKAKLEKTCEKVGTSSTAERELVREVCIAFASREPAGKARERVLAVCRRAP